MKRLLLLGLDAGDINYIQSRASALPCLQHRLHSGTLVTLEAPKALSGSVWPTFYNGADPGVHGIYQHLVWDAQRMGIRRIGADWCYYRPFWEKIEEKGHRVIVLDVPHSFPVALKNGIKISDWATHAQTFPVDCSPKDIQAILNRIGNNPIGRETPIHKTSAELHTIQRQLIKSADLKGRLIVELARQPDWDLFIAIFGETHRGGHLFFSDNDEKAFTRVTPLLEIYQAVDRALTRIFEQVDDETTVVVFAAHGMARDYSQGHLFRPLMKRINEVFVETYCGIPPKRALKANSLIPYLRKALPSRLQYAIGASAPDSVRQWVVEHDIIGGLDWSCTPAFALRTDIRTEIRLNLLGRESQGMLKPNSALHHQYVDFLTKVFLELRDCDTEARLVDEVVDTHRLFPGPRCAFLPDFVITWQPLPPMTHVTSPLVGDMICDQPLGARGGDHTDFGFAMVPDSLADLHPLRHLRDLAGFSMRFFNIND